MDKQIPKIFTYSCVKALFLIVAIFFIFLSPAFASPALEGLDTAAGEGYGQAADSDAGAGLITNLPEAIGKIIGSILQFVGAFFLILTIYGGFTWMFARGNDQEVTKAKDIIEAALIGLVIVLAAYAITSFVGNQLIG